MSAVHSTMLPLGTPAPDFALPDVATGKTVRLTDFAGAPALLIAFICNHCPYVIHLRDEMVNLVKEYQARGLAAAAISSNYVGTHPADAPDKMAKIARDAGFTFPYLYDGSQDTARAYHAACTPDFYVFDSARRLAYRGQFDDSRPGSGRPVTGADVRAALDAVLTGKPAPAKQKPSIGCNIKWIPGKEPDWFPR